MRRRGSDRSGGAYPILGHEVEIVCHMHGAEPQARHAGDHVRPAAVCLNEVQVNLRQGGRRGWRRGLSEKNSTKHFIQSA